MGDPPFYTDAQHSGLRIVRLEELSVRHKWFVLADAPQSLTDAFQQGQSPRRKQKRNSEAITSRLGPRGGLGAYRGLGSRVWGRGA